MVTKDVEPVSNVDDASPPDRRPAGNGRAAANNAVAGVITFVASVAAAPKLLGLFADIGQLVSLARSDLILAFNIVVVGLASAALFARGQAKYRESTARVVAAALAIVVCGTIAGLGIADRFLPGGDGSVTANPTGSGSATVSVTAVAPTTPPVSRAAPTTPAPGIRSHKPAPGLTTEPEGDSAAEKWTAVGRSRTLTVRLTSSDNIPQHAIDINPIQVPADAYVGDITFECRTPGKDNTTRNCDTGDARSFDILPIKAGVVVAAAAEVGSTPDRCPDSPGGYARGPDNIRIVGGRTYCLATTGNMNRLVLLRLGTLPGEGDLVFTVSAREWDRG